ncbi:histidinol phosphate phosphatase [Nisaea acidiphila]|uniref:Histidinol phosphate phosphatase n=1 Tax=Nisaea acidiphila TaxID=1862145 RepID=A0A9J7AM20_9PROT|nr:inositol monophosphatase family protein [Nisaea acidiphila]UUX48198.1 histidinol phosphate phosphatase [Nisaea acidiphila]
MTRPSTAELAAFACSLADAARGVIRRYHNFGVSIEAKADESPVTIADRTAEKVMRALIEERYPEHGIAGEEFGTVRGDAEFVWSLDPIDGTKAFITGSPRFGTLIGLVENGSPVLGVIDMPVLDERFVGGADFMTRKNGSPVTVRSCAAMSDAILAATSPSMFDGVEETYAALRDVTRYQVFGGDCHNFATLASGHVDLCVEAGLQDYDFLAIVPVIEAAGGIVTDWKGDRPAPGSTNRILASGDKRVHDAALEILSKA